MLRAGNFLLIGVILAAVSLACVTQGSAQAYPNVGTFPIPMQPNPPGTTFPYQDPLSGGAFNMDGTNSLNPVISAGTQTVSSVTYNLQTLTSNTSITFKGQNYTVYSAVPQNMTVDNAYKNSSQFYDPTSLTNIDFTIPSTINGGNPTALATNQPPTTPTVSPYTGEKVYLTTPPTDPNSLYFVPNLPNSTGSHNGLTANIYFVGDSYIGKPGYAPDTSTYPNGAPHLTPYGWASNPTYVNASYLIYYLDSAGGNNTGNTTVIANNPVNYWKHSIQGFDSSVANLATQIMQGVQTDANYPFPSGTSANYLNWLVTLISSNPNTYKMNGLYMHVQPQPGFQRNLLRYYTAWGSADIYNQSSDLFVRADGTIELPAVQTAGTWQYVSIVAQTWDGSQRFTLLNQTKSQVPSTLTITRVMNTICRVMSISPGRPGW